MPFANKDYVQYRCSRGYNYRILWPRNLRDLRCLRKSERIVNKASTRKYRLRRRTSLAKTMQRWRRQCRVVEDNAAGLKKVEKMSAWKNLRNRKRLCVFEIWKANSAFFLPWKLVYGSITQLTETLFFWHFCNDAIKKTKQCLEITEIINEKKGI